MLRTIFVCLLAVFHATLAFADDSQVTAFPYMLHMSSRSEWMRQVGAVRVEYKLLSFRGDSVARVPGSAKGHSVVIRASSTDEGVDLLATESVTYSPKPEYPRDKPETGFHFEIKSIVLSPEGMARLSLRFKDSTEDFRLRYIKDEGLRLEAVNAKFGDTASATVPEFVNLTATNGETLWQCNPLTISATKNGKVFWRADIPLQGRPEVLRELKKVLFVKSSAGHAYYILKETGELVLYDATAMAGNDPSDDLLKAWKDNLARTYAERQKVGFFRFIRAAVLLNERRAIPLLIECIDKGEGLEEKCAAIAALEKFNGRPEFWVAKPGPSSFFKKVGMDRVFPAEAMKAEREKWEVIFKGQLSD
ncbi:MAG: hypothetical protein WD669_13455 [Pirellulales bacterium]